ncbi:unnamed protein product [Arctia plantaginis]|uniref:Uncharacterized protein n=1 Tax=Arctia plantaginis TaxID=874455 RepID=A0A8S0ZSK5_ARCPL|nr:unnamed protein product [Arctia plantaginis]
MFCRWKSPAYICIDEVVSVSEEWCAGCGASWCGACAVAAGAGLVTSHVALRLATLLLAGESRRDTSRLAPHLTRYRCFSSFPDLGESLLQSWLADLAAWLRSQVFVIFEQLSERDDTSFTGTGVDTPLNVDETCRVLLENTPALLNVFGEETVSSAAKLLVTSFTHKEINKDIIFRVLDLFAGHFNMAAELKNPTFDST